MWFHFPSWVRFSTQKCGPPPEGQCRRGAEGRPLRPSVSLLYCCRNLSLAFAQDLEASQTDFHGRIKEQFFLINFLRHENKYFHNDMSYDFSCSKTTAGKILFYKPLLDVFSKNSPKFHFEGSDGWSSITVRCFAPAEVKASNPFWRKQWRGVPESSFSKTLRNIVNKTRTQFGLPP